MPPPHHVDSTAHPRGEHALWAELQRLNLLLRQGARLVEEAEALLADQYPAFCDQLQGCGGKG